MSSEKYIKAAPLLALVSIAGEAVAQNPSQPNIVWLMAEDISSDCLRLYNPQGAITPNVEWMARNGVIFENAYSSAPVSSAARTTLITGCYAPRLAGSYHRKLEPVRLPENLRMFPSYLREKGYFTANSTKTDYNCFLDTTAWCDIKAPADGWRERKAQNQPFFFVRTEGVSHESCLQFAPEKMNTKATSVSPQSVNIYPYLPDTKLMRYTVATFYDRIADSDRALGDLIEKLRADNLLDDTVIIYFGDNGGSLPGTKGYTYDLGVHVPMIAYVPPKWRDKWAIKAGSRTSRMVSFMDMGATMLALAGAEHPAEMDGQAFMGQSEDLYSTTGNGGRVVCYGDRFDELYTFTRTLRDGKYKYTRNFIPYHSKSLYADYRYKQAAFREWKELWKAGKLNAVQSRFFEPQGAEELYDLERDPYETRNLAADKHFASTLKTMRAELKAYMLEKNDLGLIPEAVFLMDGGNANPIRYGIDHKKMLERYYDLTDWQLIPIKKAESRLLAALKSVDEVTRYWAWTVCATYGKEAEPLLKKLDMNTAEPSSLVASRRQVALYRAGRDFQPETMTALLHKARSGPETLMILNDMAYLRECGCRFNLTKADIIHNCEGIGLRIKYINQ